MFNKLKKNYFILILTFLFIYFFFNLLDGERGLISLLKKENLLTQLKLEEQRLVNNIKDLEFKNSMLNENLDLDYIEILIREKFVFSMKNERLYILNEK